MLLTQAASASPTPTMSAAQEIVAPLLDLDEVDIAKLALPPAPEGVDAEVWTSNATCVRSLAVASLDEGLWDTEAGLELVAKVSQAAPRRVAISMAKNAMNDDPALAIFWGPTFAADDQPSAARTVDARWTVADSKRSGENSKDAFLQLTTVYTMEDDRHIVIEQQFGLGSARPAPDLGNFTWSVGNVIGGEDTCRYYTDAVLAPSDSPDLDQLAEVVEHVTDQTDVDTTLEDTDIAVERTKACSPDA